MGSDDKIYGDAPDNMDDLMDTGGYDLVDQYVSNVYLCNELTKSTVLTIAMIHLNMDHMSRINIDGSCNSRVGNVNALPTLTQTFDMNIHWLLDSGASVHVTNDLSDFTNYHAKPETATTATGIKEIWKVQGLYIYKSTTMVSHIN